MISFDVLASGSSGNCLILNDVIALDMGVTWKQIAPCSKKLRLVWVSHQHGDHFKCSTIRKLASERPRLRFAGGPFMAEHFLKAGIPARQIDVLEAGKRYDYGLFELEPVELFHDVPCHGLKLFMNEEKTFYVVDTGYIDSVDAKNYDLYLIEANHTRAEIEARIAEKQACGEFAYEPRAARNHLSYEQALDWLARNAGPKSQYVLLHGHTEKGDEHGNQ